MVHFSLFKNRPMLAHATSIPWSFSWLPVKFQWFKHPVYEHWYW